MALCVLAGLIATTSPFVKAQSASLPQPILRIETGMHTAFIRSIGADRAGRFLVTASLDKTARVWELPTGRLLRVLRPPIGDGLEGLLEAAAISPDGDMIAVGGVTRMDANGDEAVYLFDRENGRLVRRLAGLPGEILRLSYSPDGTRLAATFGQKGVRVWRTTDWVEIGRDTACDRSASYGADFDRAGRLVTSCEDGTVRLYDPNMRLLKKREAPEGKNLDDVRFSPDGSRIAIGYMDRKAAVDVLAGDTLNPLYQCDTSGLDGDLGSVAWSGDGTLLYAGGSANNATSVVIRRWSAAGRGPYVDAPATNSISDLAALPSGGMVYASLDPAWGILDASHRQTFLQASPTADYMVMEADFLTDATGSSVVFRYDRFHPSPGEFRPSDRTLTLDPQVGRDLHAARTEAPGLAVTNWEGYSEPRLNSVALEIGQSQGNVSRSLAIAPDNAHFLLGTNIGALAFDRGGHPVWAALTDLVEAVNITGDGRFALTAHTDGTIHWYRMSDGRELLTFFPHADRKRWVLWTPSGYYDASPGGEDLIGWHVNNGKDQAADFFPAGQFRATYYRPDVIAQVLATGDEVKALELANAAAGRTATASFGQRLPPVVEIVSPTDRAEVSATSLAVRFTVRAPSGEPVTIIRALVDGRPVVGVLQEGQDSASSNGAREMRVTIPERDCEIAIIAENRYAASVPATVRLAWHGPVPRGVRGVSVRDDRIVIKPKLYVLAIGVSQYGNPQYSLAYAAKDARDFVAAMMAQNDGLYRDVVVYRDKALTDAAATKDDILDGLDWIRKETTSNDVAMVFFAGHGVNDQNNYYFFYPFNVDPDRLMRTGLPFSDIKNAVSAVAGKALVFVDTCHSGNSLGLAGRRGTLDINIVINELSSAQNGVVVFSASTGSESSYERPEWNNGAFTKALVEGLAGAAAIGTSGRITYNMLNVYVSDRVKDLTKGQQHPTMISPQTVPDFPIALKK
jgi:WD40 repeat protein